jgi:prevent-host-death family protein
MPLIGIREFARKVSQHVDGVVRSGEPVVLTRHGRPVAALIPLNAEGFEDFVLAHVPEFTAGMIAAKGEVARGETRPLDEVLEEIDREEEAAIEASPEGPARKAARC